MHACIYRVLIIKTAESCVILGVILKSTIIYLSKIFKKTFKKVIIIASLYIIVVYGYDALAKGMNNTCYPSEIPFADYNEQDWRIRYSMTIDYFRLIICVSLMNFLIQSVAVDNDGVTCDSSGCRMKSTGWPTDRNTRRFHF